MEDKADEVLTELHNCPYVMFRLLKGLKEVEGGMSEKVVESCVSV